MYRVEEHFSRVFPSLLSTSFPFNEVRTVVNKIVVVQLFPRCFHISLGELSMTQSCAYSPATPTRPIYPITSTHHTASMRLFSTALPHLPHPYPLSSSPALSPHYHLSLIQPLNLALFGWFGAGICLDDGHMPWMMRAYALDGEAHALDDGLPRPTTWAGGVTVCQSCQTQGWQH